MIFKGVREGKPYPEHRVSNRGWAAIPPRQFRLDELITVTTVLALDKLLSEDSTFYGDLFSHVVRWNGDLYLEDGLHRAVRSALRNRIVIHARMLDLDALDLRPGAPSVDEQLAAAVDRSPSGLDDVTPRDIASGGTHRRGSRSTGWNSPPPQRW